MNIKKIFLFGILPLFAVGLFFCFVESVEANCGPAEKIYGSSESWWNGSFCTDYVLGTPPFPSQGGMTPWYCGDGNSCQAYRLPYATAQCGTAATTYAPDATSWNGAFCNSGGAQFGWPATYPWTLDFSMMSSGIPHVSWSCWSSDGTNFSQVVCDAYKQSYGSCGSANGVAAYSAPSSGLCSVGTASAVTTGANSFTWTCSGTYGYSGLTSCSARRIVCGDGYVDGSETCEGSGSQSCTTGDGYSGTQYCSSCSWGTCTSDQYCGDGSCNGSETISSCVSDCDTVAPTVSSVSASPSCMKADGSATYTLTISATDASSGIGGTYGIMGIVNYNTGNYRGYFAWNPSSYVFNGDQIACSGVGGYASKYDGGYGNGYVTLTGCSVSSSGGNQRTVTFTVRPGTNYGDLSAQTVSVYVTDGANNVSNGGWYAYGTNFSVGSSGPVISSVTSTCVDNLVNVSVTASALCGLHATPYSFNTGSSYQASNSYASGLASYTQSANTIRVRDTLGNYSSYGTAISKTCAAAPTTPNMSFIKDVGRGKGWVAGLGGIAADGMNVYKYDSTNAQRTTILTQGTAFTATTSFSNVTVYSLSCPRKYVFEAVAFNTLSGTSTCPSTYSLSDKLCSPVRYVTTTIDYCTHHQLGF